MEIYQSQCMKNILPKLRYYVLSCVSFKTFAQDSSDYTCSVYNPVFALNRDRYHRKPCSDMYLYTVETESWRFIYTCNLSYQTSRRIGITINTFPNLDFRLKALLFSVVMVSIRSVIPLQQIGFDSSHEIGTCIFP